MGFPGLFADLNNGPPPWEFVALVAVLAVACGVGVWAWVWYTVQVRRAELAALSSDEQAARLLGEALGKCGSYLSEQHSKEIWDAFTALPSDAKRTLTLALTGLLAETGSIAIFTVGPRLVSVARSFFPGLPKPSVTTEEDAREVLSAALDRCGVFLSEAAAREVWNLYGRLPREGKGWLAVTLDKTVASVVIPGNLSLSDIVLSRAREASEMFDLSPPNPAPAVPS